MSNVIKSTLKRIVKVWPWPVTANERYDRQTEAVLKKVCKPDMACIDIGCYKGEILSLMQKYAPNALHIAFEPIPQQYQLLQNKFGKHATIYPFALGDENKESTFNFVVSNPTYSGLKKRTYKGEENIDEIKVQVRQLDQVVPTDIPIRVIKIDVEGGEYDVLRGGVSLLKKWRPYLIFEHGIGGADKYGASPGDVYRFLVKELGYTICLMEDFLQHEKVKGFSLAEFEDQFWKGKNCYFLGIAG
ncbi:MAG TPA: FkbM family methyltransferase [Saprospiraceae bacterium]|nr:FkbM family methyltransferase [Saprospiraceae bacterium]